MTAARADVLFLNALARDAGEFKESDHPRGQPENAGQFGSGGAGGEPKKSKPSEALAAGIKKVSFAVQTFGTPKDARLSDAELDEVNKKYGSIENAFTEVKKQQAAQQDLKDQKARAKTDAALTPEDRERFTSVIGVSRNYGQAQNMLKLAERQLKKKNMQALGLSVGEATQIIAYTSMAYKDVNKGLRDGAVTDPQWKYAEGLSSAIRKLPKKKGTFVRGVHMSAGAAARYKVGETIEERAFTSTSPTLARAFAIAATHTFEVRGTGYGIGAMSETNEGEVLFDKGSRFKVVSNDGSKIVLEHVA